MLTKLQAVNTMLAGIGEAPVTTLASPSGDVSSATALLDEVRSEVLGTGWSGNTDDEVVLSRDVSGHVRVPEDAISVDTVSTDRVVNVVIRVDPADSARKLWDRKANTFVFERDLKVRIVRDFEFEALDARLRAYIAAEAAVRFQSNVLGSNSVDVRLRDRRNDAWAKLLDHEAEQEDVNVLTDSPHCAWTTYRRGPLWGT
jgi:hypothetical protein